MENCQMDNIDFEVGDKVLLADTGEIAEIISIYRDFAWVLEDRDGFETVELSELTRLDQHDSSANPR
jgi:hypothetical protein